MLSDLSDHMGRRFIFICFSPEPSIIVSCRISSLIFFLLFSSFVCVCVYLCAPLFLFLICCLILWNLNRLLDPNLESSGSLFVGSYILQLILHLPSHMAIHIRDLVAALVRRMQSAQIASLRSSLLVVFARLVI